VAGNKTTIVSNGDGVATLTIKEREDIFGNKVKTFTDKKGREVLSIKHSTDIFGNRKKTISRDGEMELPDLMRYLLNERDE